MDRHEPNIGTLERVARIVGGALAAAAGLYLLVTGASLWLAGLALALIALGLDFVYRGLTGYCPLYARLRWSTAHRPTNGSTPAGARHLAPVRDSQPHGARIVFPVLDLACAGGDARAVERVIERVPGVLRAYVNPVTESAYVDYDPERVTSDAITAKVRALGYGTKVSAR